MQPKNSNPDQPIDGESATNKFIFPQQLIESIGGNRPAEPLKSSLADCKSEASEVPTDGGVSAGIPPSKQVKVPTVQVKASLNDTGDAQGHPFPMVEPYPDPVSPAKLFDEMSDTIQRYVVIEKEQADAAALWVAHTHLVECFDVSPLAIIDAPEKECAKTLFQGLLGRMCYRPLLAANASPSALFRSVEMWTPTILFDEADTFFKDKPELQGMVNAGYKRGGFVLRSEAKGNSFEPKVFSVYCPKSVAGIALVKHLPDSTMSRGIVFSMRRKLKHEKVERLRHADPRTFTTIAAKLVRFAEDYAEQVRAVRPVLPEELSDRAQDNWEPLLAIAASAGPAWIIRATAAALKLSGDTAASTGNELLADIQGILARLRTNRIRSADLIVALCADAEAAWATYNNGRPLTPRQLSKLLSVYGISPKTVRQGRETPKGYDKSQFDDVFARYLGDPVNLTQQGNDASDAMARMAEDVADDLLGDWGDAEDPPDRGGVADKKWHGPTIHRDDEF
jgi:putative DNA primase/helicase